MDKLTIAVWNEAQMEEKINIATNLIRMRALLLEQIAVVTGLPIGKVRELSDTVDANV